MLEIITPIIVSLCTAAITWFFARKKNREALKSMELDNEIKSAKYYQTILDDMSGRLDKALNELIALEERHRKLMEVNRELVHELQKFKQLNGKKP